MDVLGDAHRWAREVLFPNLGSAVEDRSTTLGGISGGGGSGGGSGGSSGGVGGGGSGDVGVSQYLDLRCVVLTSKSPSATTGIGLLKVWDGTGTAGNANPHDDDMFAFHATAVDRVERTGRGTGCVGTVSVSLPCTRLI